MRMTYQTLMVRMSRNIASFLLIFTSTDVLDQFTSTKLDSKAGPSASGPGRPTSTGIPLPTAAQPGPASAQAGLLPDDDEFARQMQAGMQDLLGELDTNPEMAVKFEELMKELSDAAQGAVNEVDMPSVGTSAGAKGLDIPSAAEAKASDNAGKSDANFQETIRKTMERMQTSSESASAAASSSAQDDFLASLLKEMESNPSAFPAGDGNDEDFSKMLMGMMEQLTNKEILYEPMKELSDKFPAWMEENKGTVDDSDWKRYEEQHTLATEIVKRFEAKDYSDDKVECREYIVERMQKVSVVYSSRYEMLAS